MDRMRRATDMARGTSAAPTRKGEDESLVLFGELYRHDQEKEVNLLEPMFSVEFEAIQGDRRMYKLASGKRDYLLTDGEKHDYDRLKTPPDTPLFSSLEMEADSSQMVFQRELPVLQPFSGKPEAPSSSSSTKSESPMTSSSSKSATQRQGPTLHQRRTSQRTAPILQNRQEIKLHTSRKQEAECSGSSYHRHQSSEDNLFRQEDHCPSLPGSTNAAKSIATKSLLKNRGD